MAKSQKLFVTFEGTEGAGKSTLIQAVESLLVQRGMSVCRTREPGGNPVAEKIRELILGQSMDPLAELFLYEASRAEHLARVIEPALKEGKAVLCDRFTDSSLAYQAHARGLPWKTVVNLNTIATKGISPELTVLLDIDPAVGLSRAREQTRFEAEGLAFQKKVRQGFLLARKKNPKKWLVLKVEGQTPEVLASKVIKELEKRKLLQVSGRKK
jgi:dTMP kinase